MLRWLLLLTAVAAAVVFVERDRVAPYAPAAIATLLQSKSVDAPAAGSGRGRGGGGGAPVAVDVASAEPGSPPVLRDPIGPILPVASTVMTSESTGTVTSLAVADGAVVKKGDLLVSLDDRTIRAQIGKDEAALARDQVTQNQADATLQRALTLVKSGAYTTQQGEDARSAAAVAAAVVAVDQATISADHVALDKLSVKAPFDGRLGAFQVSAGALVTPGTEVVRLTQTSPVYAGFTLAQENLSLLQKSLADGTLSVTLKAAGDGGEPLEGRVTFIDNTVDPASGTIALRAIIDNADGRLVASQSISVRVKAGERTDLVLVPTVAVQPRQDGATVYVVKDDGTVSLRKVEVALAVGDRTGLSSGLSAGERVVVEGQGGLTDGAKVKLGGDAAKPADGKPAGAKHGDKGTPVAEAEPKAATP